jgi:hypothetical protein
MLQALGFFFIKETFSRTCLVNRLPRLKRRWAAVAPPSDYVTRLSLGNDKREARLFKRILLPFAAIYLTLECPSKR